MYMAFALPMVRRNAIATVLQVRLSIESNSPLLRPSPSSSSYLISPGQFMPDTNPWRRRTLSDSSQFVQKTLRQILHKSPRHTALWISARHMWQNSDTLASVFWRKVSNYREAVRPIIVETSSHVGKYGNPDYVDDGSEENLWVDYHSSVLSKRIGLDQYLSNHENPPTALIILRPDLYVAHSCLVNTPEDIDEALSFLSTYLKQN
ncbi:uncharacterized protein BYT42DRAFT_127390 [Radiomyces spectabilis]|uniref:uncharacterized protein n=1 Tax=Radiomyces spectabilis TaxID=64574 RepID=UPI00221EC0F9|nr:uncharacterized protein BYT42DRAFT_127390 [Radiomyces spectabilis]KAI8367469.1 hypothetical protein BYT42DRAFT_127390 [Radiomyces spectabilis]